jgi:serine/threonine protein phosphatase PrpC
VNQDAYLNRPEVALWAVADGMGGHKSGEMASRAVVTALGAIPPSDNLDTLSAGVRRALQKVNADLLAMARGFESGAIIGSTVIALVAAGRRCAALWSGDSRLYRYRSGVLSQVTEDHSLATELSRRGVEMHSSPEGRGIANVLTNAIGAQKELIIDAVTDEVLDGDIYLLCSDGLVRELRPEEIADILSKRGCEKGSEHLIDLALARGARDNVTVVLACACPGEGHFMQDQEGSSR